MVIMDVSPEDMCLTQGSQGYGQCTTRVYWRYTKDNNHVTKCAPRYVLMCHVSSILCDRLTNCPLLPNVTGNQKYDLSVIIENISLCGKFDIHTSQSLFSNIQERSFANCVKVVVDTNVCNIPQNSFYPISSHLERKHQGKMSNLKLF